MTRRRFTVMTAILLLLLFLASGYITFCASADIMEAQFENRIGSIGNLDEFVDIAEFEELYGDNLQEGFLALTRDSLDKISPPFAYYRAVTDAQGNIISDSRSVAIIGAQRGYFGDKPRVIDLEKYMTEENEKTIRDFANSCKNNYIVLQSMSYAEKEGKCIPVSLTVADFYSRENPRTATITLTDNTPTDEATGMDFASSDERNYAECYFYRTDNKEYLDEHYENLKNNLTELLSESHNGLYEIAGGTDRSAFIVNKYKISGETYYVYSSVSCDLERNTLGSYTFREYMAALSIAFAFPGIAFYLAGMIMLRKKQSLAAYKKNAAIDNFLNKDGE